MMKLKLSTLVTLIGGLVAVLALVQPGGGVQAQTTVPALAPIGGGFSGVPPWLGGTGLLVTTEMSNPAGLARTLRDTGCETLTIAATEGGAWSAFVAGAPEFVNTSFPVLLAADTPFSVRCFEVVPLSDPQNATFDLDGVGTTLIDGNASVPAAPGSPIEIITELTTRQSYAYLDGDAVTDAALVLRRQSGGSGTFSYLSVVRGGVPAPAPSVLLGDRIIVDRVAAGHGQVSVTYLDRKPNEPFAAAPTVPVTRRFKLEGGALVEIGTGTCEASNLDDLGSFVFVTSPAIGAEVFSGFTVEGCSRTFESTVNWRLLARDGSELASGFTMGGGVDGAGRFSFSVSYVGVTASQVGNLEVFETDASGGAGFPPPQTVIPLVIR